jgi:hypothetical protein
LVTRSAWKKNGYCVPSHAVTASRRIVAPFGDAKLAVATNFIKSVQVFAPTTQSMKSVGRKPQDFETIFCFALLGLAWPGLAWHVGMSIGDDNEVT